MNLEYLRNFIKLVHYQSFSELAKDIKISQSTLSHQLSQIEKDFGVTLIDRTTKKFELTEEGKVALKYAKNIIDLYDKCQNELNKFKEIKIEKIVISASTIPGSQILPKYIADFRDKNPNANFKVLINNSEKSLETISKDLADFAGIGSFMDYNKDNFDFLKIGEDEIKFICSPNHELLKKQSVNFNDIVKFPFIWREKGSGTRNTFETQFPNYKKLNIKLEVNDNDSIISTVNQSNYISVMSKMLADKAESAGLIEYINIKDYPLIAKRPLYLVKLKEKVLNPLKKQFWNELESKIEKKLKK